MNDFLNKVITIAEVSAKEFADNTKFTVKDTNGDKYNFRIKKSDGTQTKAFLNYSQLGVKQGGTYEITYAENDKEYMGRHYKDRMILGFKPTSGSPTTIPAKSPISEANRGHSDDFSRRLGVQGHINALLSNPEVFNSTDLDYTPSLVQRVTRVVGIAIKIEDEAEKQLNPSTGWKKAEATFKEPTGIKTGYEDWKQDSPPIESFDEPPMADSEVEGIPF